MKMISQRKRWTAPPWAALLLLGGLALLGGLQPAGAGSAPRPSHEVKAEFLPVFAEFVRWPQSCFQGTNDAIVIGVLGADAFGEALDRAVARTHTAAGRPLQLKRSRRFEDLLGCQMLFICKSEAAQVPRILAATENSGVLTVSESEGFAAKGGVINFFLEGNKVRFEINVAAARKKELKISSQLLGVARVLGYGDEAEGGGASP